MACRSKRSVIVLVERLAPAKRPTVANALAIDLDSCTKQHPRRFPGFRADDSAEYRFDRDAHGDREKTFGDEATDNHFPSRAFCNERTKFGDPSV
jgi:hypothetical protein